MKKIHLLIMLIILTFSACNKDELSLDEIDEISRGMIDEQGFYEVIRIGDDHPLTEPLVESPRDTVPTGDESSEIKDGVEYVCKKSVVTLSSAPEEFVLYDPNSSIIYPGNLIQGRTIQQPTPEPIPLKRGAGSIVMTTVNGAESVSRYIDEVSIDQVYDAQNQIINENSGALAARLTINIDQVNSKSHLGYMLQLNAGFDALFSSGSLSASLQFSNDRSYNRFLVRLNQSFFTMAYRLPESYSEVFAPSVSAMDLERYIEPDNPAVFVSSVTYGRIFYLLFESTSTKQEFEASLNATFNGGIGSGGVNSDIKSINQLENIRIKAFALGGKAGDALNAVASIQDNNIGEFMKFLSEAATIKTGVPISYVLRSLKNPTKTVRTSLNTSYEITNCNPRVIDMSQPFFHYYNGNLKTNSYDYDYWYVYRMRNTFDNRSDDYDAYQGELYGEDLPGAFVEAFDENVQSIIFDKNRNPQVNNSNFKYPGGVFKNSDYSIFVLLGKGEKDGNLFFNDDGYTTPLPREGLTIGFKDDKVSMSHNNGFALETDFTQQEYGHIYTFVYSRKNGMKIYRDGTMIAEDQSDLAKESLINNLNAKIGAPNNQKMSIIDVRSYGTAASQSQIEAIVSQMQIYYKL